MEMTQVSFMIFFYCYYSRLVICGKEKVARNIIGFRGKWRHKYEHVSIYKVKCNVYTYNVWHYQQ